MFCLLVKTNIGLGQFK